MTKKKNKKKYLEQINTQSQVAHKSNVFQIIGAIFGVVFIIIPFIFSNLPIIARIVGIFITILILSYLAYKFQKDRKIYVSVITIVLICLITGLIFHIIYVRKAIELIVIDQKSKKPLDNVEIKMENDQLSFFTDEFGKANIISIKKLNNIKLYFKKEGYFEKNEMISLKYDQKFIYIELESSCLDENRIGILICDFTNSQGKVTEKTANWAEMLKKRILGKYNEDPTLEKILEVKRWTYDKGVVRSNDQALKLGEKTKAKIVVFSEENWIYDEKLNYNINVKIIPSYLEFIPIMKDEGFYSSSILNADLPTLLGGEAELMFSFIIGYSYLCDDKYLQFTKAIHYIESTLNGLDENDKIYSDIKFYLAHAYKETGNFKKSIAMFNEIINTFENNKIKYLNCLRSIAESYMELDQIDLALNFSEQELTIAKSLNDQQLIATAFNTKGMIYENIDRNEALKHYFKCLNIMQKAGEPTDIARILSNIGLCYYYYSNWEQSKEYYLKSIAILKTTKDTSHLALIYKFLGYMSYIVRIIILKP